MNSASLSNMLDSNMASKMDDLYNICSFHDLSRIIITQLIVTIVSATFSNYLLPGANFVESPLSAIQVLLAVFIPAICVSLRHASKRKPAIKFSHIGKGVLLVIFGAIVFHTLAVLFGASLTEKTEETFHWSCLMSVLCIIPPCVLLGTDIETWIKFIAGYWDDPSIDSCLFFTGVFTIIGAWVGAFPIPLDWNRPWQVWPITCVIGAICGHIAGLSVFLTRCWLIKKYQKEKFK